MRSISPQTVEAILGGLSGIVDEYDIAVADGVYGWSTRHIVIARKITEYKFSGLDELYGLFNEIVDNINPSVPIELQTIRDICDVQYGIGRLASSPLRQALYRRLIALAPGERIPWHRLIREQLREGTLDDTEYVIRDAEVAVGHDAPIDRYRVRLLIRRAEKTPSISDGDRKALLRKAYESAMRNIDHYRWDKFSYITLCDAAVALVERGEVPYVLDEAIAKMREAVEKLLDPDMSKRLREYEDVRRRLH